jgi:hypothetical protein
LPSLHADDDGRFVTEQEEVPLHVLVWHCEDVQLIGVPAHTPLLHVSL